ncbi:right-handed parallel beta-helix repeat-containing protein [Streptomyces sp. RLB3-17]|uniref:right-handed parallel beta-helix repeat-containing protein n=1 Tax=Streptomyces sp. RLB3-17 TaxID=2594455 RepID=UPI001163FA2B|nr:right-handed parallel beta-helix repeat-containing protein [Streptomyces sp. RLB3-17]
MQVRPVIACVSLLAGALVALSGTPAQAASTTQYVSPSGTDSAAGTQSAPTTLTTAISRIASGGTIYLRGGTYAYSSTITIPAGNNGTSSARTTLSAYPGETPVLNFSAQSESSSNRGLQLYANYWRLYGITVQRAGDNGIYVGGSNNVIERTVTAYNRDVFRYDVSHNNIDDGWDLYTKTDTGAIGPVTIEYSLSYKNGTLSDGTVNSNGDRNGYKLGGDDIAVNHVVQHDIAYGNGHHGFTYNSNPGKMTISNNASVDNAQRNFSFDAGTSVFRTNTSCRFSVSGSNDKTIGDADSSNQFWTGTNGSRCSSYRGTLGWSFASDGHLAVTFGGKVVTP